MLAPWLAAHWINLRSANPGTATTLVRILGISALLSVPRSLYAAVLRGCQRMSLKNGIDVGVSAIQQAGIIAILIRGGSPVPVVAWIAVTSVLGLTGQLLGAATVLSWQAMIPRFTTEGVSRTLGFSVQMISISALSMVHTQVDKIVVSKLLPISAFGYYGAASSLVTRAALVTNAIADAAYPSLSQRMHGSGRTQLRGHYNALQDLLAYTTIPVFAGIVFFSVPLFSFLFGVAPAHALEAPTALLSLGSFMNGMLIPPS